MGKKAVYSDFIKIVGPDGKLIIGVREVTGSRTLTQQISYQGRTKIDSGVYRPDERAYMDIMARDLLIEIVKGFL